MSQIESTDLDITDSDTTYDPKLESSNKNGGKILGCDSHHSSYIITILLIKSTRE